MTARRVILLAGPSGSGKSRVAQLSGRPKLALDDFYFDGDHPALPHTLGIVDWDDIGSWDVEGSVLTVVQLCRHGSAEVPHYDIGANARTEMRRLDLGAAPVFIAEGVFAPDIVAHCQESGVDVEALYLDRPRSVTFVFRLVRDLSERRKPPWLLIRRGVARWRAEPEIRRHALALGCRRVSMRQALSIARRD